PDRKHDVVDAALVDVVSAFLLNRHCWKRGEIAPRHRQRGVVDIDRLAPGGAVGHRPVAVAPGAAADIEKEFAAPVFGAEMDRPAAELLLVFGAHFRVAVPLIAEPVGRSGQQRVAHAGPSGADFPSPAARSGFNAQPTTCNPTRRMSCRWRTHSSKTAASRVRRRIPGMKRNARLKIRTSLFISRQKPRNPCLS